MVRVLTWNVNGLRSVVAQRGSLVALLDGLCAGVSACTLTTLRAGVLDGSLQSEPHAHKAAVKRSSMLLYRRRCCMPARNEAAAH